MTTMKDGQTSIDVYNEKVNQLQASVDLAFQNRKMVHLDGTKSYIVEVVDSLKAQAKAIASGQSGVDLLSADEPSIVAIGDPTLYPVLLRISLAKVHPNWTEHQVATKAGSILSHEFEHGGEALRDPNLKGLLYCVMFVQDDENGQTMIQPFVKAHGGVDYEKIASAPGEDQSAGDKAFIANLN